jgi:hypothetical protein
VTGTVAGANLRRMLTILEAFVGALLAALRPRASLVAENLMLRQQLAILRRATPRLPRDARLRGELHHRAASKIEHPRRDFAVVPAVIAVDLAPKDGRLPRLCAVHDDVLAVQWVPRVVDPPNVGLVITRVATSTTRTDLTCRSTATRQSRAPSNRRAQAKSSHFRASAGCTTAIRGLRDPSASVIRHHRRPHQRMGEVAGTGALPPRNRQPNHQAESVAEQRQRNARRHPLQVASRRTAQLLLSRGCLKHGDGFSDITASTRSFTNFRGTAIPFPRQVSDCCTETIAVARRSIHGRETVTSLACSRTRSDASKLGGPAATSRGEQVIRFNTANAAACSPDTCRAAPRPSPGDFGERSKLRCVATTSRYEHAIGLCVVATASCSLFTSGNCTGLFTGRFRM